MMHRPHEGDLPNLECPEQDDGDGDDADDDNSRTPSI